MNKKIFYVSIFLILVLFLSGCAGGYPTAPGTSTDEANIKIVINNYISAINSKNWNSARSFCVYGSDAYFEVGQIESLINNMYSYCSIITINYVANISYVSISGNYAQAYTSLFSIMTCDGLGDSASSSAIIHLQKIGSNWKIYSTV
jgi:hypothetical protein